MCVHFQLKAKGCLFYLCFYNQSISIQQHVFSSPDRKQINCWWAHVSSLVSSTTSPRWAPASTTWRSWRTSPARWWVRDYFPESFHKIRLVDNFTAPAAVWPQKMILSVTKKFVCTIVCCDQYASSWNVRQNIIGRGSQLTSSSRSRDAVAQCKWHSGVIQSPASLQFPYKFQARSDRKVTTSLAWLGSS